MTLTVDLAACVRSTDAHLYEFERQRRRLTSIADRILDSRADAEDVVQDAWLRWCCVELAEIANSEAFLTTVITRLALDRRRAVVRRREVACATFLAEIGEENAPHAQAEAAETLSLALHLVLRSLSPLERAAFVLREAFDLPYDDLACLLCREEPAVRQLVHRARCHLAAGRIRFDADASTHDEFLRRFRSACNGADLQCLLPASGPPTIIRA